MVIVTCCLRSSLRQKLFKGLRLQKLPPSSLWISTLLCSHTRIIHILLYVVYLKLFLNPAIQKYNKHDNMFIGEKRRVAIHKSYFVFLFSGENTSIKVKYKSSIEVIMRMKLIVFARRIITQWTSYVTLSFNQYCCDIDWLHIIEGRTKQGWNKIVICIIFQTILCCCFSDLLVMFYLKEKLCNHGKRAFLRISSNASSY